MRNPELLDRAAATFLRPSDALLLSLADPDGNSIRRSDPDRTDAMDFGNDATCLGLARVAGGGRMATLGGAGGGKTPRAICFGFGIVDAGGNGGGAGALGGTATTLIAGGLAILRGRTVAITGGAGGAMAAGILAIGGSGRGAIIRGFLATDGTGGCFLVGVRRTVLVLVLGLDRLTVRLAGLRLVRRFVAVGGFRTRRLVRTRLLDFEITGNFGRLRYGLLR